MTTQTSERSAPTTRELTFPFHFERAEPDGDGMTLEGYAAVFESPAEIEDMRGEYTESIRPGAFTRTLSHRTPVLMFNHGRHPLIGPMPIGRFEELREDERGLYMRARLFDNWLIWPLRDAIKAEAIDGASFRMDVKKDRWSGYGATRSRELIEVAVPELGPVVFPAYADAKLMLRSLYDFSESDFKLWTPNYDDAAAAVEVVESEEERAAAAAALDALDTADEPGNATSSTSVDATTDDDSQHVHSSPSTPESRAAMVRRIELERRGITKEGDGDDSVNP